MREMTKKVVGNGSMVCLIREFDWPATCLGSADEWPDVLLNAVNMILAAPIPMQLFWGPEFICIYNDAMVAALSDKHPASLGQSARAVWSEAWEVIGPQMESVLKDGKAYQFNDVLLPLLREGQLEDQYWSYSYSPMLSPDGTVAGVLDVAQNTTESFVGKEQLKRAAESIRRSEERFRLLTERATVGINIGDSTGSLTYMNKKLLDLLGYTVEDIASGRVRWDGLTPVKYADADKRALAQLKATGVATPYEKSYRAKDGHLVPVQIGATLIPALSPDAKEDDIAVFFVDLTEQKKIEAALMQSEKLGAVGKLASAISHDINNPLESITNVLFIVSNLPDLPQEAVDYIKVAERELARVSHVAAQTLRFHRLSTTGLKIHPDFVIEEILSLYESRLTNFKIEVKRDYRPDISLVCFEGDFRQVLNNVIRNAVDSLHGGGRLTIRTREATRWSSGIKGVRVTVADNGAGLSPEARDHIFDAFYTTKGIHGTGLGLWISCRIVHKHRGYIRAANAFGRSCGAVFQVWLPSELAPSAHEPWHDFKQEPSL